MALRRPRYHLFDLVMVVALCGLALGLVQWLGRWMRGTDRFATFWLFDLAFGAWLITWIIVRANRRAGECPECGRRPGVLGEFTTPSACPRCRLRSLEL